jgi:hypothetical protein
VAKTPVARAWSDAFCAGLSDRRVSVGPELEDIESWLSVVRDVIRAEAELAEALAPFAADAGELERTRRIAVICRRAADELNEVTRCAPPAEPVVSHVNERTTT